LKQNRPNGNDWGDYEKISIEINGIWVSDVAKMDNRRFNTSEMDDKWFNAIWGAVRFIKAHITPYLGSMDTNLSHYCAHFSNFIFVLT